MKIRERVISYQLFFNERGQWPQPKLFPSTESAVEAAASTALCHTKSLLNDCDVKLIKTVELLLEVELK
jgi:hypothetical protein